MNSIFRDDLLKKLVIYALLIFFAVIYLGPFIWTISTSFKPSHEVFPFRLIPDEPTIQNYITVFTVVPYARWFFNSLLTTTIITVSRLILASMAGYALARIDFPGRDLIFMIMLGTMMIPMVVTIVPTFIMMRILGWINTYQGWVFPGLADVFGIFLMRQFFLSMPMELEEAAKIDGLGRFGIWRKIAMPLAKPALGALTIFSFQGAWNDFMWPFIILTSEKMFPLTVGINAFQGQYETRWNLVMAGAVLMAIPVIIIFIIFQNLFIKGVSFSGVKG